MGNRIASILVFILIALIGWREYDGFTAKKYLRQQLNECNNELAQVTAAAQRTDTIYDTIFDVFYIPKPYPVTSIDTIHDTITGNFGEILTTYADSVPSMDITLFYVLKTSGTLKDLQLSYRLRQQQTISDRIIYKDRPVIKEKPFALSVGLAFGIKERQSAATVTATYNRYGVTYIHDVTTGNPMLGFAFKFQ